VCRFHIAAGGRHVDKQLYGALVRSVTKLASITFLSLVLSSTGSIYLGFITERRLAAVLITPSLGVPNWSVIHINTAPSKVFWRCCRGERRLLQGESRTHNLLLCFCFALLYFFLHLFIKNTKKLVPFIVVIFVGLLLPFFIMLCINGWFL
jgi:hypothetical protein